MENPTGFDDSPFVSSICPHTGATVFTNAEWTDVHFGDNYYLTIRIIEDNIISVKVTGFSTYQMIVKATNFTLQVINSHFGDKKEIYYIGDFHDVEGITKEARSYYLNYVKNIPTVKAFILSSPKPFLIFIGKLSKRFNLTNINVYIEKDYPNAIRQALNLSQDIQEPFQKIQIPPVASPSIPSVTDTRWSFFFKRAMRPLPFIRRNSKKPISFSQLTHDDWSYTRNNFSAHYELIDGDIIHRITSGDITQSCLRPMFDLQRNLVTKCELTRGPYYLINNVEEIQGTSLKIRKKYVSLISEWITELPVPDYVIIYGANRLLQAGISISTFSKPITILFAENFRQAIAIIQSHKESRHRSRSTASPKKTSRHGSVEFYANELNRFLSNIDWEQEGTSQLFPDMSMNHPFKTVYDAMALIKVDIDELFNDRNEAQKQIHALTQELMKAQENERRRIARDLHDNVAQDLASLIISSETLFDDQEDIPPKVRERSKVFATILRKTIASIRDLVYDLRPPGLAQMGVVKTVDQYCQEFSTKNNIEVELYTAGLERIRLDIDTKINLFRILQEALNNIKKHAHATSIKVRLIASHPDLIMRVEDDGVGFDLEERQITAIKEKRMGLKSMEERVNLLGGKMILKSRLGSGTRVAIKFPCHEFFMGDEENEERIPQEAVR